LTNAGAVGRRLSTIHSRQRCAIQLRRELRMVGCSGIEGNMRGSRLRAFAEAAKIATGRDACLPK
jgi:hypothetical protein